MAFYLAPFTFEFPTARIRVDVGVTDVLVIDLYEAIKRARESEEGIIYDRIADGSGRVDLGAGTQVGLTVSLVGSWQLKFPDGDYIARVGGGNLVGGPGGDPIAYSAGVQTLLIQSAASTVVNVTGGGSGLTAAQVWAHQLEPGFSASRVLRTTAAAAAGKTSGAPAGTPVPFTARNLSDTADQVSGEADENGNRGSASYGA